MFDFLRRLFASPPTCSICGSRRLIPIIYGLPSDVGLKLAKEGKAMLGGCFYEPDSPSHACLDCIDNWGKPRPG